MRLIDIHSHLNFKAFAGDAEAVIRDSLAADVGMFNVGTQLATSQRAIALSERFPDQPVWAVVGQHPIHVGRHAFDCAAFFELAKHPRVVAIGECGLDYYRLGETYDDPDEDSGPPPMKHLAPDEHKRLQRELLLEQIAIAEQVGKPLMLHCRDAYDDLSQILKAQGNPAANLHCFTAGWDEARRFLDLGCMISFTGIITFPKSEPLQEVVKKMPLDRLMVETDAPYLAPVPYRGKRNLPPYVEYIARKVAELRGESFERVAQATLENARRLFHIA